jgi:hypothetical protein
VSDATNVALDAVAGAIEICAAPASRSGEAIAGVASDPKVKPDPSTKEIKCRAVNMCLVYGFLAVEDGRHAYFDATHGATTTTDSPTAQIQQLEICSCWIAGSSRTRRMLKECKRRGE